MKRGAIVLLLLFLPLAHAISCPGTVSTDLTLSDDVDGLNASATCITITGANVTLDCAGFSISGNTGQSAIQISSTGVTVQNCNIQTWQTGVTGEITCNQALIQDNTIEDITGNAVELIRCDNIDIISNNITNASIGVYYVGRLADLGINGTITDNTITTTTDAAIQLGEPFSIFSYGTVTTNVLRNRIRSAQTGIREYGGQSNQIDDNIIIGASQAIEVDLFADGTSFDNNTLNRSSSGIFIQNSDNLDFSNTEITLNSSSPTVFSIYEINSGPLSFINITADANGPTWFDTSNVAQTVNFTSLTFSSQGTYISFLESIIVADEYIDSSTLNITAAYISLDSGSAAFLNTTSNLTFISPGLTTPQLQIDVADNGTFVECVAPRCTNIDYTAGVFRATIIGFSTYQLLDIAEAAEPVPEFSTMVLWALLITVICGTLLVRKRTIDA